jgi:beta-lactamase class A
MKFTRLFFSSLIVLTASGLAQTSTPSLPSPNDGIKKKIEEMIARSGAEAVAVAFHDLATNTEINVHGDTPFHAASTMKIPVMIEVFRRVAEESLALDQRLKIKNEFFSIVDGSSYKLSPDDDSDHSLYARVGQTVSISELLDLMITVSSNLATNILIEQVGASKVTQICRRLGANSINVLRGVEDSKAFQKGLNNTTTATDLMILLEAIASRRAVSADASERMITILLNQRFNEGIPAGLSSNVRVAHKTGSITKAYHDAAIVYVPNRKPYILVVLTRGFEDENRAHTLASDVSRAVFEAITRVN